MKMIEAFCVAVAFLLQPPIDDPIDPIDDQPGVNIQIDWDAVRKAQDEAYEINRRAFDATAIRFTSGDAVNATSHDLNLMAATEEWVASVDPGSMPKHIKDAVAALGQAGWKNREKASKALEAHVRANPADARWLFRARRSKDPEIAVRVQNTIRRLNPCPTCEGRGHQKDYDSWECSDCLGFGTAWLRGAWD